MKKILQTRWFEIVFLALISACAYLPRIREFGYYHDDWYFLYDTLVIGPKALIQIALHTRPIRGPLYALYFSLYGLNPFPYHVTMYVTRLLGGIGALWLFNLLWPGKRHANFFMAVLFLLFPGFLWWVAGFEFQPYVLSVGLQAFSVAFTLKAISSDSASKRLGWTIAAIISGLVYLALVEYAIGMEAFRLLCIYLYVRRKDIQGSFFASILRTLKTAMPHLLIPVTFLFWYQFLFDNWRKAQDAGTQLGILISAPTTMLWRGLDLLRSFLNVSLFAWVIPFYQNFYGNRLKDTFIGLVFATFVVILVYFANKHLNSVYDNSEHFDDEVMPSRQTELLLVGGLGTLAGILPIVLANRLVTFERISQYSLPASLTGAIFLGGLIYSISPANLRTMVLSVVIGLAVLSHQGLAARAVIEERVVSDFWKQVVWRAPDIKVGTTLVVTYPGVNYSDGDEVVWGPANFIYHPERQQKMPVEIPLPASRLESDSILRIIAGHDFIDQTDLVIKFVHTQVNYQNQLIMTQPSPDGCVHVLNANWNDLSIGDQPFLYAAYQNSKVENIIAGTKFHSLPVYPFGLELSHGWCFYYEKADLARQTGNWAEVARLGDEAQKLGLHPNDQIEWMPFLQAYALQDNLKQVKIIATRIRVESIYKHEACANLTAMASKGMQFSTDMQNMINNQFCQ